MSGESMVGGPSATGSTILTGQLLLLRAICLLICQPVLRHGGQQRMHCSISALHLAAHRALWTAATELGAMCEVDSDMLCEVGLAVSGVVEP